jgi:hypothetical protein
MGYHCICNQIDYIEKQLEAVANDTREECAVKWISVDERLPEYDTEVLVWDGQDLYLAQLGHAPISREIVEKDEYGYTGWQNADVGNIDPTHWRPTPTPPQYGKGSE